MQVKLEQTEKHRDLYKKEGDKRQEHIDDLREQMDHQKDQLIAFSDRHDQEHKMLTTIKAGQYQGHQTDCNGCRNSAYFLGGVLKV